MRYCPALFVSAPASNQGKTTVTAALARYHRNRGLNVRVFKTGPDFLDPMILEQASGNPVYQLDLWMGDENHCRALLYEAAGKADLILIEGVMGLFDGDQSSADLAILFGIPVLAIIDGRAMAQTFGAIAYGLANYRAELSVAGVFANYVAGERHYEMLLESLSDGMACYGWFKRDEQLALPERHLGLVQAEEIQGLDEKIDYLAEAINITEQLQIEPIAFTKPKSIELPKLLLGIRIAVASDSAFAFCYRANNDLLQIMGAKLIEFSPLQDTQLPEADALYFPGGYPELYLNELAKNTTLHSAIKDFHRLGKPIIAECGGMLYLLEYLTNTEGEGAEMVGLLSGEATMQTHLTNLGMHSVELPEGKLHGHTFHYSKVESSLAPLCQSQGARAGRRGEPVYRQGRLNASYLHLYFPSNPKATAQLFAP